MNECVAGIGRGITQQNRIHFGIMAQNEDSAAQAHRDMCLVTIMKMAELAQKMVEMKMSMWEKMVDGSTKERMYESEGEYACFFYKFISFVASYVGPIQTGFLMAFLVRFQRNRNRDSCSKRVTGTDKTGIQRIPAEIGNLVPSPPTDSGDGG